MRTTPREADTRDANPGQDPLSGSVQPLSGCYAARQVIFDENHAPDGLYVIVSGCVRLTRKACRLTLYVGEERAPATIATLGLFDGGSNGVTGIAMCNSTIDVLPLRNLDQLLHGSHDLLRGFLGEVTHLLRQTTARLDLISLMSVRQRIARVLLEMSQSGNGSVLVLPCSRGEFALCLGTVREVLVRNLHRFEVEGTLSMTGREIRILNRNALQHAAEPDGTPQRLFDSSGLAKWAPYIADYSSRLLDHKEA